MAPAPAAPPPEPIGGSAPHAPAESPSRAAPQRTMLGVQAVNLAAVQANIAAGMRAGLGGAAAPTPSPAPAQPAPPPQAQAPHAPSMNATMLGMPAVDLAALRAGPAAPPSPAAPPQPVREKLANATMLGMPAVALPVAQPAPAQAPAAQPLSAAAPSGPASQSGALSPSPSARPQIAAQTNRTMLGVSIPLSELLPPDLAQAPSAAPATAPAVAAPASAWDQGASSFGIPAPDTSQDSIELPGHRRGGRGVLVAALALVALLVLVASGVGLFVALRGGGGPDVRVAVTRAAGGEALEVTVPGAEAGTKLRFGAMERPLEGDRATFPLAPDTLHVGANDITVVVVAPGGDAVSRAIALQLDFRVRADLGGLARPQPTLAIVVDARPGSVVMLDGAPLPLDAAGHATRAYPLDLAATRDGRITHVARYAITPPGGAAAEGAVTTEIPLTPLQLERPGLTVLTDRDSVEIAGAVDPAAMVTIDGVPVAASGGRFAHRFPLPAVGTHTPRVVAVAPGKAPHAVSLTLRRVASLEEEARTFGPDRSVTYARLRPAAAAFVGQRVAFEGRIYNVEVTRGTSIVQMLVRDCPRGERCPLWVTYPAATELTVDTNVRVLGTVAGEHRYPNESGRENVDPRVDAAFLLPLAR